MALGVRHKGPRVLGRARRRMDGNQVRASDPCRSAAPGRSRPLFRVLRAVLRRRLQGAAGRLLGDPASRRPEHLPKLGLETQAADLLRVSLRQGRRRPMILAPITIAIHTFGQDSRDQLVADVRAGLARTPRSLPPRWFYDERGSALFEAITRLPEYYLTRTEAG